MVIAPVNPVLAKHQWQDVTDQPHSRIVAVQERGVRTFVNDGLD
jgi:hypothetical protein